MKNKGQIGSLAPIVLTMVLIGVLIGVGMMVLAQMQSGSYTTHGAISVNETLAAANSSGIVLTTGHNANQGVCGALTSVYNGTTGKVIIGLGNFTQTGCTIVNATDIAVDYGMTATSYRYNYPYNYGADSGASTAVGNINTSIGTLAGTWIPILVIVVAAALIITILLGGFGAKRI